MPASTPSADLNSMSIARTGEKDVRTSIEAAIATATHGTSQTSETFQRRALTMRGCGYSGAGSGTRAARRRRRLRRVRRFVRIASVRSRAGRCADGSSPDQARIERPGGEQRQDDDGGERQQARRRC